MRSRKFSLFFYFFLTLFMYGVPSYGQSLDSSSYPVLWLRADKGMFTDTSWADFSGNGYYGLFFGQGQKKQTLLNYNPALTFNGADDSVRIAYNFDSLSEMTYIAVFVPTDTSETAIWSTGNGITRNTRMTTHRVNGPDSTVDTLLIAAGMPALCTVMQTWQRNDSVAPSPSAYFMVGSGGVVPPFKGALAELLVFDRSLDVLTQVQYETYLALKYGIPLTSGNYVSAGQAVLWDASKNKDFKYRIAGLGRENYFSLAQRQAVSAIDADSLLVVSRGDLRTTNAANTDSLVSGGYLIWGDNNKALSVSQTSDGQLQLLNRGWLMAATGVDSVSSVTTVRLNKKNFPASADGYWLVLNTGGYNGFPVDSLTYCLPDSVAGDSVVFYRHVRWDPDHSGKDLFGFAQGKDLLLKLHVLDTPTCENQSLGQAMLQAIGGTGPYNYRVMNGSGAVLASGVMDSTVSVGGLAMGSYSILLNDSKGHQSLRSLQMAVPHDETLTIALAPSQTLPAAGSLLLDASTDIPAGAAQSYQWVGSNGFNATTPSISVSEPGTYQVAVTSVAGCIFRDTVTVSGEAGQKVSVYPSPSVDGNFTVSVSLPEAGPVSVGIYDINGNKVQETTGNRNSEYRFPGHLSTPGVYMIMVKTPHGVESRKLMIL
ncbi:MAG TPA: T9SS type A sorting domain-containing protein [Puia sp.]|nr:T9SS type A sorting domain-containing protein [Puia sp.]